MMLVIGFTQAYWAPGNGAAFLDLVEGLTGAPLVADAWVADLQQSTDAKVSEEKSGYEAALKIGAKIPAGQSLVPYAAYPRFEAKMNLR